jgi:chorismate mutase
MIACRGVRGATTVEEDTPNMILSATRELLVQMIEANGICPGRGLCLPAPPHRIRRWLIFSLAGGGCAVLINECPTAFKRCIRVLVHWNTTNWLEILYVPIARVTCGPTAIRQNNLIKRIKGFQL